VLATQTDSGGETATVATPGVRRRYLARRTADRRSSEGIELAGARRRQQASQRLPPGDLASVDQAESATDRAAAPRARHRCRRRTTVFLRAGSSRRHGGQGTRAVPRQRSARRRWIRVVATRGLAGQRPGRDRRRPVLDHDGELGRAGARAGRLGGACRGRRSRRRPRVGRAAEATAADQAQAHHGDHQHGQPPVGQSTRPGARRNRSGRELTPSGHGSSATVRDLVTPGPTAFTARTERVYAKSFFSDPNVCALLCADTDTVTTAPSPELGPLRETR